jgi:hypothetical protein
MERGNWLKNDELIGTRIKLIVSILNSVKHRVNYRFEPINFMAGGNFWKIGILTKLENLEYFEFSIW